MKATVRGAARRALVVPSLAAAVLLLAGCVPLDDPGPLQDPPVAAPAQSASAIPGAWEYCQDPVATAGELLIGGWKVFAAMEVVTDANGHSGHLVLDGDYLPVITFDGDGPPDLTRFTQKISEDTGFPADGFLEGVDRVEMAVEEAPENGRIVSFSAVEEASLPFTLSCGNNEARGTLRTWNNTEFGIIDCTLAPEEPDGSPAALAREEFCPKA
ncbi:hypothetical protein GCM10009715_30860 [Paeniglutamicibacter psychrophenolicus]|uniref:Lipoprotein n=1 Tax=Paeniglutamicibacter psychrophenolicus TaxID=257454 RepID=A0ABS4W8Z0_9MICC|nr:hypothetical protein [Paeniglutamicibacter psychrophenolicus]MBP2372675.1 hypothetical protein [Paeniglutamicibacter psychrophenolicus]